MPLTCVANNCFNRGRSGGITYHKFPANEDLCRKWLNAVKRKDWEPTKYSKLCSAHFREEDRPIDRTSLSCVRIREGVVPVIFPVITQVAGPGARGSNSSNGKQKKSVAAGGRKKGSKTSRIRKELKDDKESKFEENLTEVTFEMIDIEEPIIKQEVLEDDEFNDHPPDAGSSKTLKAGNGKQKSFATASSRKRINSGGGEGELKMRLRPSRRKKELIDGEESEFRKSLTEDQFQMMDIEEPIIKQEVLEDYEFNNIEAEGNTTPGTGTDNLHFETVYCSTNCVKEEPPDYDETVSNDEVQTANSTKTDTVVPDFVFTEIKTEPLNEVDREYNEKLEPIPSETPLT